MAQSLMKVNVHLVFSTKYRIPALFDDICEPLHLYFGGILRGTGCIPIQVGGGYAAFSVNERGVPRVKRYIQNQVEHHRKEPYQDEVLRHLKKHNIEYDERYLWD